MTSKKYLCEYRFSNSKWAIEIDADSHKEAEERLKNISSGRVLGEIKLSVLSKNWNFVRFLLGKQT